MQQKKYADTDFFLALLKDTDWLKQKAREIYHQNKENIWVTPFTVAEIMIICIREKTELKQTLLQISRIAQLEGISWKLFFKASEFVEQGATLFDSLLMASCEKEDVIITSDTVYEKYGFNTIDLKKK